MKCKLGKGMMILFVIIVIFIGIGLFILNKLNKSGVTSYSVSDANPNSKLLVSQWLISDFDKANYKIWNKNPEFRGYNFDTGLVENCENVIAPEGKNGWGFRAYSWSPISASRFIAQEGRISIYARHNKKGYGNGTVIQGWVWERLGFDDELPWWYCPEPLNVYNKKIIVSLDLKINKVKTYRRIIPDSWILIGTTFWFKSQEFPNIPDNIRKSLSGFSPQKMMVIDLAFYLSRNIMFSRDDPEAYRYQRVVVLDKKEAIGHWKHYNLDLSWFIRDALERYGIEYAADTLELYSMEFLCELKYAEADFEIKNFALHYRDSNLYNNL